MRIYVFLVAVFLTFTFVNGATTRKPRGVTGRCGGNFNRRSGSFASPNFPNGHYPPNSTCDYTVTVPEGSVIKFEFSYVDMEDGPNQKLSGCWADYVVITEVDNEEGPMVGDQRFCGYDTPYNPVFTQGNKAYVWFRSDDTVQMEGFVLKWSTVDPTKEIFNCDFESKQGFCRGWRQLEPSNRVRWRVNRGRTRSSRRRWVTGPEFDHTRGNLGGSYVFAEATGMRRGEVTTLVSPPASIMKTERYCLSFWYHMFGSGVGTLAVYDAIQDGGSRALPRRGRNIFVTVGDQGASWHEAKVTLNRKAVPTRFIFEATRGMNYRGDIAIDDITISEDECPRPK